VSGKKRAPSAPSRAKSRPASEEIEIDLKDEDVYEVVPKRKDKRSYEYEPLDLGKETERILLLPDTHAPFHDARAWDAALRFARKWRPHTVVHLGDWLDCLTVSDHDKDPRRGTQLEGELVVMRGLREEVDELPGIVRKIFTRGNHEYRLERYAMRHAPALISILNLDQLMGLTQNGWHVVPYMQHGKLGKLRITHGTRHSGAYAVHQNAAAFCASVAFGHTHRLGLTYFGDVDDNRHVSASLGWLGDLNEADYVDTVSKRYWQHGFGTALMKRDGRFELQLRPIVDGEVID
jgi:predicted phosphodiesterase